MSAKQKNTFADQKMLGRAITVSYTHLTLPTKLEV